MMYQIAKMKRILAHNKQNSLIIFLCQLAILFFSYGLCTSKSKTELQSTLARVLSSNKYFFTCFTLFYDKLYCNAVKF